MAHFVYHFRTNDSKLYEMLALRSQGWSYTALAEKFECPKLTIRFLTRKYGLNTITVQFTRTDYLRTAILPPKEVTVSEMGERINEGKTYAQYIKEEQERSKSRNLSPLRFP